MKKLFQTIFVSALSILLFTMPAFAAAPEAEEIPVVAQSVQETAWAEATVVDGQASVQLEDGVQVTVSAGMVFLTAIASFLTCPLSLSLIHI